MCLAVWLNVRQEASTRHGKQHGETFVGMFLTNTVRWMFLTLFVRMFLTLFVRMFLTNTVRWDVSNTVRLDFSN